MTLGSDGGRGTPVIDVHFDPASRRCEPGGPLAVRYRVGGVDPDTVRAIEASVVWYTEGKGEEDLSVHMFDRIADRDALRAILDGGGGLEVRLPPSPLSYEGVIVKIRWCVRVRVFHAGGRDFVSEHVFEVGSLPPAKPAVAAENGP